MRLIAFSQPRALSLDMGRRDLGRVRRPAIGELVEEVGVRSDQVARDPPLVSTATRRATSVSVAERHAIGCSPSRTRIRSAARAIATGSIGSSSSNIRT